MNSDLTLRMLPFAVIIMVVLVDVVAGPSLGFLPLLTLGPTFASVYGSVRRTAFVGLLALAVCTPLAFYNGLLGRWQHNLIIATIIGVTGASMLASHLRSRHERELADVRMIAEAAQRVLLRPVPRRADDVTVALSYTSAMSEARIGGDLYEVVTTPYGVRLLIGDVQGKGLEAVETAAWVLGAFREAAYNEPDLPAISDRLETTLSRHLEEEAFVTAILGQVDGDGIQLLNHGHPPPILLAADGRVEEVEPQEEGLALGLGCLGPGGPKSQRVSFADGDRILFYTDGVIEARDPDGAFYPLKERVPLILACDPETALDELRTDLINHIGGPLLDDAAMLLLHRQKTESP
ncbi:PP2C family protein-serine/threonine phosphatase [Nonomuraea sp. 10N515B]|uniref:PP2C family protein-serine/threonine phosphatase n=1 Tax=Nonomuraea sp. 10N515B TaxID=3457422 RepID=UPI003FCE85A3